jgi:hypothetical protein
MQIITYDVLKRFFYVETLIWEPMERIIIPVLRHCRGYVTRVVIATAAASFVDRMRDRFTGAVFSA